MGHGKGGGGCVMIDWSGGHSGWESVGWGLSVGPAGRVGVMG